MARNFKRPLAETMVMPCEGWKWRALPVTSASARFSRTFSVVLSGNNLLIADRCAIRSMSTTPPFNVTTLVGTRLATDPNRWDCSPGVSTLGDQDLDLAVRGTDVYVAD